MTLTLLFPRSEHPAIEERYASWQNRLLLQKGAPGAGSFTYDPLDAASKVLSGIEASHVVVVTNPLFVSESQLPEILVRSLEAMNGAFASVPAANESPFDQQIRAPSRPYLTLRQFEDEARETSASTQPDRSVRWDGSDPGVFVAATATLRTVASPLSSALSGQDVVVASRAYIHRYSSHRGQVRTDLLERISTTAESVLEFGCGEAALGAALKERQSCRVVGVELDRVAAEKARTRIDAVHSGDVRQLLSTLDETFDWIVGGDILEHLEEPWSFLSDLRRLARPGARLLLSLPNIASWPIASDLLRGRFDYVYMGILCAGHVRFFTRSMIEEMLQIAGWSLVSIEPQEAFITPEGTGWLRSLAEAGIPHSAEDLTTPGFYVTAQNVVSEL